MQWKMYLIVYNHPHDDFIDFACERFNRNAKLNISGTEHRFWVKHRNWIIVYWIFWQTFSFSWRQFAILFFYRNGVCPFFGTSKTKIFVDKFVDRELAKCVVHCENKEYGCAWQDRLRYQQVNILLHIDSLNLPLLVF